MTKTEKMVFLWARMILLANPKEKQKIIRRLGQSLKKKKKLYLLTKILQKTEELSQREKQVWLVLSRQLKPKLLAEIKKKIINILGADKEIKTKIDQDIIAGFRIKTDNLLIKASLKDFLEELKEKVF